MRLNFRGKTDNLRPQEQKQHAMALKVAIQNLNADEFINHVRNMRVEEGVSPHTAEQLESLRTHHKAFHEF